MLLKPSYEKPIDYGQDLVDRGLEILNIPGTESMVEIMKQSPYYNVRARAEQTIISKVISWKI